MTAGGDQLRRCLHAFPERARDFDPDLAGFWELAKRAGVAVLIANQQGVLTLQRDLHRAQAAQGIRVLAALRAALKALTSAGIPAMPLKGPMLGSRLYGDFTLRPTSDVDLLVREADLDRALAVLRASGAELTSEYAANQGYFERHHHHLGLAFRGVLLELHWQPSTRIASRFSSEALFARARRAVVLDAQVPIADPTDELLFLALHAAGHNLERELWLLDLKQLARRGLDWPALEWRARSLRIHRAVGAALLAAEERVAFPAQGMPARWRREASRDARWLPRSWAVEVPSTVAESIRNLASDVVWADSRARGLGYFAVRVASAGWRSAWRRLRSER